MALAPTAICGISNHPRIPGSIFTLIHPERSREDTLAKPTRESPLIATYESHIQRSTAARTHLLESLLLVHLMLLVRLQEHP